MSRNSSSRDDTSGPNPRMNVFLAPSQSSARLPAHVSNASAHPSLNPALFQNQPSMRRLSSGDLVGDMSSASSGGSPKDAKEIENQKNLAKQKQKDQNLTLQLDSLGLPDATPVREALRALHARVTQGEMGARSMSLPQIVKIFDVLYQKPEFIDQTAVLVKDISFLHKRRVFETLLKEHEPALSKRLNDVLSTPSSPLAAKEVAGLLLTRLLLEKKDDEPLGESLERSLKLISSFCLTASFTADDLPDLWTPDDVTALVSLVQKSSRSSGRTIMLHWLLRKLANDPKQPVKKAIEALDLEALHIADIEQQDNNSTLICWALKKKPTVTRLLTRLSDAKSRFTVVHLLQCQLASDDLTAVFQWLKTDSRVTELNLTGTTIDPAAFSALTSALLQNNSLTSLKLVDTRLGECSRELTDVIASNSTLKTLQLQKNSIPSAVAQDLVAVLSSNTTLTDLNLKDNQIPDVYLRIADAHVMKSPRLDLSGLELNALPKHITMLTRLNDLTLQMNLFTTVPAELASLTLVNSLRLGNNKLTVLPPFISNFQKLEKLRLENNYLDEAGFPEDITKLTNLTMLYLENQNGKLTQIPKLVYQLTVLKWLWLDENTSLTSLSPQLTALKQLERFSLVNCRINEAPAELGYVNSLQRLWMSGNKLKSLPPTVELLTSLNTLLLVDNELQSVPIELGDMKNLKLLDLSGNRLASIPATIGKLTRLQQLSLKNNNILELPRSIMFLTKLTKLDLGGNVLSNIPPNVLDDGCEAIQKYLTSTIGEPKELARMKVMFIGSGNSGKTTLVKMLVHEQKPKRLTPTEVMEVEEWRLKVKKERKAGEILLRVHDFPGKEDFGALLMFYLSDKTLYILTVDLSKPIEEEEPMVAHVLHMMAQRVKDSKVILVGTKADQLGKGKDGNQILADLRTRYKRFDSLVIAHFAVNTTSAKTLRELSEAIRSYAMEKCVDELIPQTFLDLERYCCSPDVYLQEVIVDDRVCSVPVPPIRRWKEFVATAAKLCVIKETELTKATRMFRSLGFVLVVESKNSTEPAYIILRPQWLLSAFTNLINLKPNYVRNTGGMFQHADLQKAWQSPDYPEPGHGILLDLLRRYDVLLPFSVFHDAIYKDRSFIPRWLPHAQPVDFKNLWSPDTRPIVLTRRFQLISMPIGFFPRLMVRMFTFLVPKKYWQHGMIIMTRDYEVALIYEDLSTQSILVQIASNNTKDIAGAGKLMRVIIDCIHELMENCFDLSEEDMTVTLMCTSCLLKKLPAPHVFQIGVCEEAFASDSPVKCPVENTQVPILELLPDWGMEVFKKIPHSEVIGREKIGDGSFGEVFKGAWNNVPVVAKVFRKASLFRELRKEAIYTSLVHPCVIALRGIGIAPLSLVLEYAEMGDLEVYLHNPKNEVTPDFRYNIASDICEGLSFLHAQAPPIVHRDLKSPNVLLMLDSQAKRVRGKLADFGTAAPAAPIVEGRAVDNPLWLGPEVIAYRYSTTKSDVYSFAVILWEFFAREKPFQEYNIEKGYQLEDAITKRHLRPSIPANCPINWTKLIQFCWRHNDYDRPSCQQILALLKDVHDGKDIDPSKIIPETGIRLAL